MTTLIRSWLVVMSLAAGVFAGDSPRYLAFQIFTGSVDSSEIRLSFPPAPADLRQAVIDLRDRIGTAHGDGGRLGFVLGPIAFDNTDNEVRGLIALGFEIARATDVAVGFHVDDSMFWGRRTDLNTPLNLEWLDWKGTPSTGRRLDWSSKPLKVKQQLCLNSPEVRRAVRERAGLIGSAISAGVKNLHDARRDELFLGVIAGWETQIGRDFDTGKPLGFHALANAGFNASTAPAELDVARGQIIGEFAEFWARSLAEAGVARGKVYSHIAYMSAPMYELARQVNPAAAAGPYLEVINFTPPAVAFVESAIPGLSTYPQPGHLEQWQSELEKRGNPPWASCEGTAIDPGEAERSPHAMNMERYLGNLFNHGAVLVNLFGWGVGDRDNPFRKTAESDVALEAYRKFLRGDRLAEAPIPIPVVPPSGLKEKVQRIQADLPGWIETNGPARVKEHVEQLQESLKQKRFPQAALAADAILKIIDK